jgi:hypothetical protein
VNSWLARSHTLGLVQRSSRIWFSCYIPFVFGFHVGLGFSLGLFILVILFSSIIAAVIVDFFCHLQSMFHMVDCFFKFHTILENVGLLCFVAPGSCFVAHAITGTHTVQYHSIGLYSTNQ